jgi:2'-5' RNA ligase
MRLFTAIELSEEIKDHIESFAAECGKFQTASVKYVGREELHITLKFLGEIPDDAAADFSEELGNIRLKAPSIVLQGAGAFPNLVFPKVIWIGVGKDENLEAIFHAVEETAYRYGIEKEKKGFHAHVTVARLKGSAESGLVELVGKCGRTFGGFTAGSFSLIKSRLTPAKPVYTRLQAYPLIGQGA